MSQNGPKKEQAGLHRGPRNLAFHVMGEVVVHTGGGVRDRELGGDEEAEEVFAGEIAVVGVRIGTFENCHSFEEPQEIVTRVIRRIDTVMPESARETSISMVHPDGEQTKVGDIKIHVITIDMVNLPSIGNGTKPSTCYNSMCVESVVSTQPGIIRMVVGFSHKLFPKRDVLFRPRAILFQPVDAHILRAPQTADSIVGDECAIRERVRDRRVVLVGEQNVVVILFGGKRPDASDNLINGHSSRGFGCRRDRQR